MMHGNTAEASRSLCMMCTSLTVSNVNSLLDSVLLLHIRSTLGVHPFLSMFHSTSNGLYCWVFLEAAARSDHTTFYSISAPILLYAITYAHALCSAICSMLLCCCYISSRTS